VQTFWAEKFAELPPQSRILDIACGNGAICSLAAESSRDSNKEFSIAASDLATINKDLPCDDNDRELRSVIAFHSHTPCESQPFGDNSLDFVTSQFGFEYSDVQKTLHELRRILRPDGRFVAIAHHSDSVPIKAAKEELEIYALAIDELDLLGTAARYFEAVGAVSGDSEDIKKELEKHEPLATELSAGINKLRDAWPKHACSQFIVGAISFIARSARQTTAAARRAAIERATLDFKFARARLDDMIEAALSDEQIEGFKIDAREAGFESVHCLKLYDEDEGLVGWQIHLR